MLTMNTPKPLAILALATVCTVLVVGNAFADTPNVEDRLKKLEAENAKLREVLQTMQLQLDTLTKPSAEPATTEGGIALPNVDDLLAIEPSAPQSSGATGQMPGDPALNPMIAFTFDFTANALDKQPAQYSTIPRNQHRAIGLRSVGLFAQRGVSAYADGAVAFDTREGGPEVEEGYIDINRLIPNTNIRLGKWRLKFGPYNGVHEHQLPFVNFPNDLTNFFGFGGVFGTGAEISHIMPTKDYLELRGAVLQQFGGEGHYVFSKDSGDKYSYAGRARYNKELGNHTDLDLSLSLLNGPTADGPSTLADMWNASAQLRKIKGTQCSDRIILDWTLMDRDMPLRDNLKRHGWSATYFKQKDLYNDWGLMYEQSEYGDPGTLGKTKGYNAFYTYKAQETQWFRWQLRHNDYPTGPGSDELIFQTIWSIGSHSHEFN